MYLIYIYIYKVKMRRHYYYYYITLAAGLSIFSKAITEIWLLRIFGDLYVYYVRCGDTSEANDWIE